MRSLQKLWWPFILLHLHPNTIIRNYAHRHKSFYGELGSYARILFFFWNFLPCHSYFGNHSFAFVLVCKLKMQICPSTFHDCLSSQIICNLKRKKSLTASWFSIGNTLKGKMREVNIVWSVKNIRETFTKEIFENIKTKKYHCENFVQCVENEWAFDAIKTFIFWHVTSFIKKVNIWYEFWHDYITCVIICVKYWNYELIFYQLIK